MIAPASCKIPIGLPAALREAGVSPADVLAEARLPSRLLDVEGHRLVVPEYFAFWHAIRTVSGDANMGIRLARTFKPDLTEPLFLAIMSAVDVRGAFDIVSAYKRQLEPVDLVVRTDEKQHVSLTFVWPKSEIPVPQILIDVELAFMVEVCRRGTGREDLAPSEVHMRAHSIEPGAEHAAFFRCPIRLGAGTNTVLFSAEDTTRRFRTFNQQLLDALIPYLRANTPASTTSPVSRIRTAIAERVRGQRLTLRSVSHELAMSTRALQRLLKDNGTSFREVLDDVRNEHARGYLAATKFSHNEVAFLLGFEDATSFYRAFRAWNGMSPSEYRERAMAS